MAQGGNSHISSGAVDNYKVSLRLSDADLGSGGVDTIGVSSVLASINEDLTVSKFTQNMTLCRAVHNFALLIIHGVCCRLISMLVPL